MRLHVPSWPRCPRCHNPRGTRRIETPDCLECRSWPPALTTARYAYSLEGPADELVHALKYEGWREVAELMAEAMAKIDGVGDGRARIVPVPTTAERMRARGYNQAELLAEHLAERIGASVVGALGRRPAARSQTSLAPEARRLNVRGAFRPEPARGARIAGAHVLLVDDVLTTGATAGEAASTLQSMGASSVTLVTFARAFPRRRSRAA